MSYVGLAISSAYETDTSAYSHRVRKLAECLEKKSIRCDFFHVPNRLPFDIETAASFFMLFWLKTLRKYDFIYCGAGEADGRDDGKRRYGACATVGADGPSSKTNG
jgi:hypothetical protein